MAGGIENVKNRLDRLDAAAVRNTRGKAAAMDVFRDGPEAKVRDAVSILWAGAKAVPDSMYSKSTASHLPLRLCAFARVTLHPDSDFSRAKTQRRKVFQNQKSQFGGKW
jgi:hypothetical protein